ncbi:MAG: hypothetical protein KDI13_05770 [Alphaproteobacteria bacterium]|nr:hypothetical protein [Alphaproteobacteria bacterium]
MPKRKPSSRPFADMKLTLKWPAHPAQLGPLRTPLSYYLPEVEEAMKGQNMQSIFDLIARIRWLEGFDQVEEFLGARVSVNGNDVEELILREKAGLVVSQETAIKELIAMALESDKETLFGPPEDQRNMVPLKDAPPHILSVDGKEILYEQIAADMQNVLLDMVKKASGSPPVRKSPREKIFWDYVQAMIEKPPVDMYDEKRKIAEKYSVSQEEVGAIFLDILKKLKQDANQLEQHLPAWDEQDQSMPVTDLA